MILPGRSQPNICRHRPCSDQSIYFYALSALIATITHLYRNFPVKVKLGRLNQIAMLLSGTD